jgi:REP element-mobilizing transposase RayT
MRRLRELGEDVWYYVSTSINNRGKLFRLRQALALFAQVLGETAGRYVFEIRALNLEEHMLTFYIRPKDGAQLPRIMQWLKQTFAVRGNLQNNWQGHVWGDRYRSEVLKAEPPGEEERWTGPVMGVEASEADGKPFSEEAVGDDGDASGEAGIEGTKAGVRPHPGKTGGGVRPFQGNPAEIPRKSVPPPG